MGYIEVITQLLTFYYNFLGHRFLGESHTMMAWRPKRGDIQTRISPETGLHAGWIFAIHSRKKIGFRILRSDSIESNPVAWYVAAVDFICFSASELWFQQVFFVCAWLQDQQQRCDFDFWSLTFWVKDQLLASFMAFQKIRASIFMKNICCFYGPVILLQHIHERCRSKYPLSFALRNMIWFAGLSIQIWKLMMLLDTNTNLIRDQYSSPKKTLKLLHLHHFRDFWPFFSPVWWLPPFFWFLRRTVLACKASSTWRMRKRCSFDAVGSHGIPSEFRSWLKQGIGLAFEEESMLQKTGVCMIYTWKTWESTIFC